MTQFIWGTTVGKIARKTLINKYKEGGLQLIDVESKKTAFRIKHVKNIYMMTQIMGGSVDWGIF